MKSYVISRYVCHPFISVSILIITIIYLSHFEPLPFMGASLWSQEINPSLISPRFLVSRIGSALPRRVNSRHTNSVNYIFVRSRTNAFGGWNQIL